jgi:hypothetical protein
MATTYDDAVEALYRGPLDAFVAERKRLAGELKAAGDKASAARLGNLGRPSISAWAVNQLWWNEREAFERLLATAERLRRGEHDAGADHQRALTALRTLATARLESGGHAAPESTLRRVTTTLSALAAAGSFDPDPPGALVGDRDPPGFEFEIGAALSGRAPAPQEKPPTPPARANLEEAKRREEAERQRAQAELERKRAAEERRLLEEAQARKRAERERLQAALSAARADAVTNRREVERLRLELSAAERKLEKSDTTVAELKQALAALE